MIKKVFAKKKAEVKHLKDTQEKSEIPDLIPTLLGVAVDVSGSMRSSIRNDAAADFSRLDGVDNGIEAIVADSRRLAREYGGMGDLPLRIFSYVFGTVDSPGYADLFSMLQFAGSMESNREFQGYLEQSKLRRKRDAEEKGEALRRRASSYSGLGSLARSYGFGGVVDTYKQRAEDSARQQLTREAEQAVRADAAQFIRQHVGDTTLTVDDLARLWGSGNSTFADADRFIFGSTPMRGCLNEVVERFAREKETVVSMDEERVLLVISDGAPTDGDPRELADRLRKSGVHLACVYVTNEDIHTPRNMPAEPESHWPEGAKLLYDLASPVKNAARGLSDSRVDWQHTLEKSGWSVPDGARLFIQANHSEVLADFMRIVASRFPLRDIKSKL